MALIPTCGHLLKCRIVICQILHVTTIYYHEHNDCPQLGHGFRKVYVYDFV